MVIFDHHGNSIAAAMGPVRSQNNKSSAYNEIAVHWNLADTDMIYHSLTEPLDITDGLYEGVGRGSGIF